MPTDMSEATPTLDDVGVVLIGRNEGERLVASLVSIRRYAARAIYVDSGSVDGSVQAAEAAGVSVVKLNLSQPFTAARARNVGFNELVRMCPNLHYVHFIDGDCRLEQDWPPKAIGFMLAHPEAAVVCGIRRELHPDASIYNWMCDMEWNRPPGITDSCGGDALYRVAGFQAVSGFDETLIAGEEPELCSRLQAQGWKIHRLADTMTYHDANILHFSQWWKRNVRAGYGNTKTAFLSAKEKPAKLVDVVRVIAYVAWFVLAAALSLVWSYKALALLLVFPAQITRIAATSGAFQLNAWKYGFFLVLIKFAEFRGMLSLAIDFVTGRSRKLIEYK